MQVQQELKRFRGDGEYYEAHQEELVKNHPEQWVAIFNRQVVGVNSDYSRLLEILEQKGVPSEHTFIEYATTKDEIFILSL